MTDSLTLSNHARAARRAGNLVEAGDYYTSAAYATAGRYPRFPSNGGDIKKFLKAATSYRIAGRMERCRNRCRAAILLAEERHERAMSSADPENELHAALRGEWQEAIGICRLVGDLPNAEAAYETAFEQFEAAGDPSSDHCEPAQDIIYGWFRELEQTVTGEYIDVVDRQSMTFTEYAGHVRTKIPEYLSTLEADGAWPAPDD